MEILKSCAAIALSLWVGGLTLFVGVVTPVSFRSLGREEAGRTVGFLFPAVDRWACVWSVAAVISLAGFYWGRHFQPRSLVLEIPVAVMAALTVHLVWILNPQIAEQRQLLDQPEFQGTVHAEKFRFGFNRLHRLSVRVHAVILFLGWLALALVPSFLD